MLVEKIAKEEKYKEKLKKRKKLKKDRGGGIINSCMNWIFLLTAL
jgi:hypothetical protein